MPNMERTVKYIVVVSVAILLSIASYYLFYGRYDIFPWAVVALMIGYFSKSSKESIINGALFGYLLFLIYIYLGYKGKTDATSFIHFFLFNLFFSLVGAIAGIVGAFLGNWFKRRFGK
jgi:hypothetical protein